MRAFSEYNGYLTEKQAVKSFARACGEFAEGKTINDKDYDFTIPSSFAERSFPSTRTPRTKRR